MPEQPGRAEQPSGTEQPSGSEQPSGAEQPRGGQPGEAGRGERPIRLAIVDDDPLVRAGLRILMGGSPDIEVVAEAGDGAEAVNVAGAHWPDVMLMDIRMPRVDGLVATQRIRGRVGAPQVVVLTTFDADEYVLEALRGGASGFLLKDTPPREIIEAVRTVAGGGAILSPTVIRRLIDHVADPHAGPRRDRARARLAGLTEREREVAAALGRGLTNAEIGAELGMSVPTAKGHVSRLLSKLELNNRVQVALLVHDAEIMPFGT
ncbi:response regulator transcription factor [Dactylosporangium maewongense]|uniref:Response regulator transcription factor n=1 Tax=Dactylosporangium maewongense TaxID=634393 RepID=A0ABN1ZLF8_9ACTN